MHRSGLILQEIQGQRESLEAESSLNHSEQGRRQLSIIDEQYDENILFEESVNDVFEESGFQTQKTSSA